MHRFLLSLHALPVALMAQGNRVPTAEERNHAQPEVVPMVTERILRSRGGDIGLTATISADPALGSEIFVRKILIDGKPAGLVDTPIGVMM